MENESQDFWDKISSQSSLSSNGLSGTALKTVESTKKHLSRDKTVLDYGCGTGDLTIAIAENVKSVHAIDTSSGMIEVSKAKANQSGIRNVNFAKSSIDEVGHLKSEFDVITAFNILHYIEDTQKVSRKINELLSPGGLFISSTVCMGERRSIIGGLIFILTKMRIMPKTKSFKTSELENLIASGGFEIVETEKLSMLPDYFVVAKKKDADNR